MPTPRRTVASSLRAFAAALGFAACACFAVGAEAQQQRRAWLWQNPLPQGGVIHALRFAPDKRRGWAVGNDGVILRTDDGGFEWEAQDSPVSTPLYGLYVRDRKGA